MPCVNRSNHSSDSFSGIQRVNPLICVRKEPTEAGVASVDRRDSEGFKASV